MIIPFPEHAPDQSQFEPTITDTVKNVIPRTNGFGPFKQLVTFSDALPAQPKGVIFARGDDGATHIFAGTTTKLYKLDATTLAWTDVTTVATTYALPADSHWSFAQFGDHVLATNSVDGPYSYDLSSSTEFAALGGSPPISRVVGVIGDFVFLGEKATQSRQVTWSGVNNDAHWVPRQRLSDFQVFPDGDDITGIVGFERGGLIFQRRSVREITPALNTSLIFQFQEIERSRGAIAPGSIINAGTEVFWLSDDGFHRYGRPTQSIGEERVNRTFFDDISTDQIPFVQGTVDPVKHIAYWRYSSVNNLSSTTSNKLLAYNYMLDRWSVIETDLSWITVAASTGYTLETLDNVGTLDSLEYSLDSRIWVESSPNLAGFSSDYKLGFFEGDALEATVQTSDVHIARMTMAPDQGIRVEGRRTMVRGFRPISDASTIYGRVAVKDRSGDSRTFGTEAQAQDNGLISTRASGLYHRFEVRIPAAEAWEFVHGVEPEWRPEGTR